MKGISITKMSSRGQVVIPLEMRKDLAKGVKLVVMRNKGQIILKKAEDFAKNIEEDLEFAKRTEKAWKAHDRGEFIEMEFDDFLNEMEKW
ncbi:MAG: AbrB/MazE/SpoVT family DNA-binding domain-containing protein [Nanoarchaeota archaeon]|nr:AbrB/MazE/SpoVT family DNA-binding domain-containing protein [Nanoarchaeota archaeon]MBU4116771.1 AbrB/MazE/SpoVT family DNA-binding domain-containing protein [Nanoarchaeota archaeon]